MRALVTGGAGFIGSAVCRSLCSHGHVVVAYDDLSRGRRDMLPEDVRMVVGDIRDAARLADIRYRGGVTSYLEVLDTERQLFEAELTLARAQRDELLAIVRIFRAVGGGWATADMG